MSEFDIHALLRAAFVSLGVGMILVTVTNFVVQGRGPGWKRVVMLGIAGVMILTIVGVYYGWPSLIRVPPLDGVSRAEADTVLVKSGLVPDARPQYALNVPVGRVIPRSQTPVPGLPVRRGTVVSFAVSERQQTDVVAPPADGETVAMFEPKSGEGALCREDAERVCRLDVKGTASGISQGNRSLLLWMRPVRPPSDVVGWYLQRPPTNGIVSIAADGTWVGLVQIGNAQWPPKEGDVVDLAVSLADQQVVDQLFAEPGVVVRGAPVGARSDVASGVVIRMR